MNDQRSTRRRFVAGATAATAVALAGCAGGGDDDGGVPEAYRTATSIGGERRDPDGLSSKDAASYQDSPSGDRQCSNCRYYVEDRNDDGVGACTRVAGEIEPDAYCALYVRHDG
ncbi:high-potential iron-sulfur protein [Halapricum desulfuricans]|uniref:High potential iron-sulfur protein, Hipip family n=1 Tax=Halapricum desulfuricans TaxID=2841257 RepID=A0A897NK28_9EURY|nr:high-potential iron-sulfur protein [Halapricum desulfuricans]QSG07792.1 High potential iron-sulfur protein, Hipip family [Halapricum desulfuricans]QSG13082.1 High potential iron-sulfur protein, Hipip family [Halapricum desulfuricans]